MRSGDRDVPAAAQLDKPLDGTVDARDDRGRDRRSRAAERCSSRAARSQPPSSRRRRRSASRSRPALALPGLERSCERDRRRPGAREERQADLPRRRVLRGPPAEQPAGARRDRPARRRAHRARRRRRRQARRTASACRTTSSPSSSPASARRPPSGSAPAAAPGSRSTAAPRPALEPREPEGRRRPRPLLHRRLRGASVGSRALAERRRRRRHASRSPTGSPGPRTSSRRSPARAGRRSRSGRGRVARAAHARLGRHRRRLARAARGGGRFTVTATDDRNVTTSAQRASRSTTRSRRSPSRSAATGSRPAAASTLTSRAARRGRADPAAERRRGGDAPLGDARRRGRQQVTWTAADRPSPGARRRYQLHVQAASSVGTSSLAAPFSLPRSQASLESARCSSRASRRASPPGREPRRLRRLRPDGDRRRLPGGERARDALRGRGRRRRLRRGARRHALRRALGFGAGAYVALAARRRRSATSSARSSAGRSACTAGGRCSSGMAAGSTSRPQRLDRAEAWFERWGDLGVLIGPHHAGRPLVRLDPGRACSRCALGPYTLLTLVGSAVWCLRPRRRRLRPRRELRRLRPRLPLRRIRDRRQASCSSAGVSGVPTEWPRLE